MSPKLQHVQQRIESGHYDAEAPVEATVAELQKAMRRVSERPNPLLRVVNESILPDGWPDLPGDVPPVVMGGQGRSDEEVAAVGHPLQWVALFAAAILAGGVVWLIWR